MEGQASERSRPAVAPVTDDRMAELREVCPDLMLATGREAHLEQGMARRPAQHARGRQPGTGRTREMLQKIQAFFQEVSVELKKVSWPTRQQTMNATVVVIVVSFIVAFFLGIVDVVLARIVGAIMK